MVKPPFVPRRRGGFTLIELLVVVLILATLMAVALPLYAAAVRDATFKTCRTNMQSIANAAQSWKVRTRANGFSTMVYPTDLLGDLGTAPSTPSGGGFKIVTSGSVKDADGTSVTVPTGSFGVVSTSAPNGDGECNGFIPGSMTN